ncbi:hypothetical protein [Dielma fastidiosa]|uniref:hypothetical protein n=1 Tax=Dielma fastidiosa TaxID=1034346 RepID=UPI000EC5859E|nr:hypothetical protein [Dielma fastidiosa]HAH95210.1 hypothetical protein [Dielma fastidiosa]
MKKISRICILCISIFIFVMAAAFSTDSSLTVLVENTADEYYADVLVDKSLVKGEISSTITSKDTRQEILNDMVIMRDFEYQGLKAMQMNTYIEETGRPSSYVCKHNENGCLFSIPAKMPDTVQLLLMDSEHNLYVSDEIVHTKHNHVKVDFDTMMVTYNRNQQIAFIPYLIGALLVGEFILGFYLLHHQQQKEQLVVSDNEQVSDFIFMVIYGTSLVTLMNAQSIFGSLTFVYLFVLTVCHGIQCSGIFKYKMGITFVNLAVILLLMISNPVF